MLKHFFRNQFVKINIYICLVKNKLIVLITLITSMSLIGIIITQYIWVNSSISLREEQFKYAIHKGLSKVIEKIEDYQKIEKIKEENRIKATPAIDTSRPYINRGKVFQLIDSLISIEYACVENDEDFEYYYVVMDTISGEVIHGNPGKYLKDLKKNGHKELLCSVLDEENLVLNIFFPFQKKIVLRKMALWVWGLSAIFLFLVIVSFLFIIFFIFKQKKISEMKTDFVNNMTHEFKTPISTISVASEMLMKKEIVQSPEKIQKYANIIFDENMRLRNQVEQVLQITLLDNNELKLNPSDIDIHKIIENSVDIFNMIVNERNGKIISELNAENSVIYADELHFINLITNMIDNAIKYSTSQPLIKVITFNRNDGVVIRIEDNGIGIDYTDQKYIYNKFFRVHTGNIHNVKGFGLGLFYVKTVVEAHCGFISLIKSEINKGSAFEIFFPLNFLKNQNHEYTEH